MIGAQFKGMKQTLRASASFSTITAADTKAYLAEHTNNFKIYFHPFTYI